MTNVKISIIIPVFNMENYLNETVKSWVDQNMREIEIIYINDASTDRSLEIIHEWKKRDSRIKVISFSENSGPWSARIEGIRYAHGEYIMFADADDSISSNACAVLYTLICKHSVDILHFSTNIVNVNHASRRSIVALEEFVRPYPRKFRGEKVLAACFSDAKYGFSLWNKIYSARLCKKAFSNAQMEYMCMAEDKLAYFMLAFFAKSYIGVKTSVCYNYYYGRGGFGKTDVTKESFERFCSGGIAADRLEEFLKQQGVSEKYKIVAQKFRKELMDNCIWRWAEEISEDDKGECFDLMGRYFKPNEIGAAFMSYYEKKEFNSAQTLIHTQSLSFRYRKIRTIGTYYYSIENGGLERVLCALARLWSDMGYRVIVLTDHPPKQEEYELPATVERIVIPEYKTDNPDSYAERASVLCNIIKEKRIDLFVYHAWISKTILWDELVIKASGAAFLLHCHSTFGILYQLIWPQMNHILSAYVLADGVVTLSEMDKQFWNHFNNNIWLVNNPFFEDINDWEISKCNNHTVLWTGRLSDEKNPVEAVEAFDFVIKAIPDAKLSILGTGDKRITAKVKAAIKDKKLNNSIIMQGFHKDVKQYYKNASIFMLTSNYEGFPLSLQESMMAGLPTVMYELPYLTMVKDNPSISTVKPHDTRGIASAIIELFLNDSKRKAKGKEARAYIESLSHYDYESIWNSIINSVRSNHEPKRFEDDQVLLYTMLNHNALVHKNLSGLKYSQRKIAKLVFAILMVKDIYTERGGKYIFCKAFLKMKEHMPKLLDK